MLFNSKITSPTELFAVRSGPVHSQNKIHASVQQWASVFRINHANYWTMGWFSADEIVAPAVLSNAEGHHTAQAVALCILAGVAVGYLLVKAVSKCHRRETERVAERATRLANLPVWMNEQFMGLWSLWLEAAGKRRKKRTKWVNSPFYKKILEQLITKIVNKILTGR